MEWGDFPSVRSSIPGADACLAGSEARLAGSKACLAGSWALEGGTDGLTYGLVIMLGPISHRINDVRRFSGSFRTTKKNAQPYSYI